MRDLEGVGVERSHSHYAQVVYIETLIIQRLAEDHSEPVGPLGGWMYGALGSRTWLKILYPQRAMRQENNQEIQDLVKEFTTPPLVYPSPMEIIKQTDYACFLRTFEF